MFRSLASTCTVFIALTGAALGSPLGPYSQINLVSDLSGVAAFQDANLVNPWGIAFGASTPIWVSDNGTGLSTLYNGAGVAQSLVVTIPPPMGSPPPSAPTGVVFNATSSFGGAHFIFATEDGTIAAWTSGTTAALAVNPTSPTSVYKGVTIGNNGTADLLYATNFGNGTVDVFNSSFGPVTVPGGFTDHDLPAGYAPFNIENIGGEIFVTYALQDAAHHDDVAGSGHGFVDIFDPNGNLMQRLISDGALNSPWGLAIAPSNFGALSNDLLVGNFGDGTINAYNPTTGVFAGTLADSSGNPIVNEGLWGLAFGNGAQGTSTNALYFTAGIPGPDSIEDHGLFGDIQATPEPGTAFLFSIGGIGLGLVWMRLRRQKRAK